MVGLCSLPEDCLPFTGLTPACPGSQNCCRQCPWARGRPSKSSLSVVVSLYFAVWGFICPVASTAAKGPRSQPVCFLPKHQLQIQNFCLSYPFLDTSKYSYGSTVIILKTVGLIEKVQIFYQEPIRNLWFHMWHMYSISGLRDVYFLCKFCWLGWLLSPELYTKRNNFQGLKERDEVKYRNQILTLMTT